MSTTTGLRATADTQHRLLTAAGELLDEGGPAGVTMRAVGQLAGVSAMASYHYFPDRHALLARLADDAFTDLGARFAERTVAGSASEQLHAILDDLLDLAFARPNLYALAFTERRTGARDLATETAGSPTLQVILAVLYRAERDEGWRVDDPVEIAITFAGLVQGLWLSWHAGRLALPEPAFRALVHRCSDRVLVGLHG